MTMGFVAYLALLAAMAVARVAELVHAQRLTAKAHDRGAAPQRENMFFVMLLLHVLPFVLGPLEVQLFGRPFRPWLFLLSVAGLLILGVARIWTLRTLGTMWNVRIVEPSRIVVEGPYRFVRHPNYAIVIAELLLMPLAHGCWITLVVLSALNAVVLSSRIPAEERMLFARPGYAAAMGDKPRFIPRLRRRGAAPAVTSPPQV